MTLSTGTLCRILANSKVVTKSYNTEMGEICSRYAMAARPYNISKMPEMHIQEIYLSLRYRLSLNEKSDNKTSNTFFSILGMKYP